MTATQLVKEMKNKKRCIWCKVILSTLKKDGQPFQDHICNNGKRKGGKLV
jgi:hypothetical protein